jgi:hypothetical protein
MHRPCRIQSDSKWSFDGVDRKVPAGTRTRLFVRPDQPGLFLVEFYLTVSAYHR